MLASIISSKRRWSEMLAFSNDYYGIIFRATQSVELFCVYQKVNINRKIDAYSYKIHSLSPCILYELGWWRIIWMYDIKGSCLFSTPLKIGSRLTTCEQFPSIKFCTQKNSPEPKSWGVVIRIELSWDKKLSLGELRYTTCSFETVLREFLSCFSLIFRAFPAFCFSVIRCADHKKRPFFIQR